MRKLQINCIYKFKGCNEGSYLMIVIISYETLEKHEAHCDYQLQQYPGCKLQVIKKDFSQHETQCESIKLTCSDCKLSFTRDDFGECRADTYNIC